MLDVATKVLVINGDFIFTGKSSKKTKALLYLTDKIVKYFHLILKKYDTSVVLGILSGFIYYAQALSLLD